MSIEPDTTDPDAAAWRSAPDARAGAARPQASGWRGVLARGALWTVGGYGTGQIIRFANNLFIARLLNPEAFGLMAIVDTLSVGLHMISDTGVGPTLIHREEAPERGLLGTAFSIQLIRGVLLWAMTALLAVPLALWYEEPLLVAILPISGLRAILDGFQSTGLYVAARNLALRRLTLFELGTQLVGIVFMGVWLWYSPSVWALVLGGLVTSAARGIGSHLVFRESRARPSWLREYLRELTRFGRWVFPSTILLFVILRSDRLLLGKWLSVGDLGAYNFACFFSLTAIAVVGQVCHQVLFPHYARIGHGGPLRRAITRNRGLVFALTLPVLCGLAVFGDRLVMALYDARYQEAGWMLRMLTCGAIFACANEAALPVLLALGDPYRRFVALLWSSVLFVASIACGGMLAGRMGLVAGVAAAPAFAYPAVSWALHKHGVWTGRLDGIAFCAAGILLALLVGLRRLSE